MPRPIPAYDELQIRLTPGREEAYHVEIRSVGDACGHGVFRPPSEDALEAFRLTVDPARARVRGQRTPRLDRAKRFGDELFQALISDQSVRDVFTTARRDAESAGRGLRVTLFLSAVPELSGIPWEFLYRRPRFLAQSVSTPVVRYLDLERAHTPLAVQPPLRILGMISHPKDDELADLDFEREQANLEQALEPLIATRRVELRWLANATLRELQREVAHGDDIHVFHYIGHGEYDEGTGDGFLVLERPDGRAHYVSGEQLGGLLCDRHTLRLAILNACEGATTAPHDPLGGVAAALVEYEVPAVVGMQFAITDQAAIIFAEELYATLADGFPIDAAVTEARRALSAETDVEWATPVLFMRVPDGRVFDFSTTTEPRDDLGDDAMPLPETVMPRGDTPASSEVEDADESFGHRRARIVAGFVALLVSVVAVGLVVHGWGTVAHAPARAGGGSSSLAPDLKPPALRRISLATDHHSVYLASPAGFVVRLGLHPPDPAVTASAEDPSPPRSIVVHGGSLYALDRRGIAALDATSLRTTSPARPLGDLQASSAKPRSSDIFVADRAANTITAYRPSGSQILTIGAPTQLGGGTHPHGTPVAVDHTLYVAVDHGIAVIDLRNGRTVRTITFPTTPSAIALDSTGRLFAALYAQREIDVVTTPDSSPVRTPFAQLAGRPVAVAAEAGFIATVIDDHPDRVMIFSAHDGSPEPSMTLPLLTEPSTARSVTTPTVSAGTTQMTVRFARGRLKPALARLHVIDRDIADGSATLMITQPGIATALLPAVDLGHVVLRTKSTTGALRIRLNAATHTYGNVTANLVPTGVEVRLSAASPVATPDIGGGGGGGAAGTGDGAAVDGADDTPPVITVPAPMSVQSPNGSPMSVVFNPTPLAVDGRDGSVSVTCSRTNGSEFPVGTTTVTCFATDSSGNKATKSFSVTVTT